MPTLTITEFGKTDTPEVPIAVHVVPHAPGGEAFRYTRRLHRDCDHFVVESDTAATLRYGTRPAVDAAELEEALEPSTPEEFGPNIGRDMWISWVWTP